MTAVQDLKSAAVNTAMFDSDIERIFSTLSISTEEEFREVVNALRTNRPAVYEKLEQKLAEKAGAIFLAEKVKT